MPRGNQLLRTEAELYQRSRNVGNGGVSDVVAAMKVDRGFHDLHILVQNVYNQVTGVPFRPREARWKSIVNRLKGLRRKFP